MSSYNKIEKITNNLDIDEIVSLQEYIIFEDEENKKKEILFKFRNNVNQTLQEIEFSVVEYDENNKIIEELVLSAKELNANELSEFVPDRKCSVDYRCKRIRAKVTFARYNKSTWQNGVFKPIPFKQTMKDSQKKVEYKPANEKAQTTNVEVKQSKHSKFKLKYLKQFNRIRFSKFMAFILSIALLVACGYLAIVNKSYVDEATVGDFEIKYNYQTNSVCITKYNGQSPDVVIPSHIGGSRVNEIATGTFRDSTISSIHVKSSALLVRANAFSNCVYLNSVTGGITAIEGYAFEGCTGLKEISLPQCTQVGFYAFRGCTQLRSVNLPRADLSSTVFYECDLLGSLTFNKTSASSIGELFGKSNYQVSMLSFVKTNMDEINNSFFNGNNSILSISIKASCKIEDNLLDNTSIQNINRH